MSEIEHETDIEKLRALAIALFLENERLQKLIAELAGKLSVATDPTEVAELKLALAEAKEAVQRHAKSRFGDSTEC